MTWAETVGEDIVITEQILPYAVVLSQECDLEHDFNNHTDEEKRAKNMDKGIPSILICPAYLAAEVRSGSHLSAQGLQMHPINSGEWNRVKQNGSYRYHFLTEDQENQIPDLVIDFKRYMTVPRDIAYRPTIKDQVLVSLSDLFREHLSSRFAHYLSRIGLPELVSD